MQLLPFILFKFSLSLSLSDDDNRILLVGAFSSGDPNEFERSKSLPLPKDSHGPEYGFVDELNFSEGTVIADPLPPAQLLWFPLLAKRVPFILVPRFPLSIPQPRGQQF